ncbi:MAG: DUF4961 domain-containing protein, partial [Candidatus Kariarchaeaceae archaeon]
MKINKTVSILSIVTLSLLLSSCFIIVLVVQPGTAMIGEAIVVEIDVELTDSEEYNPQCGLVGIMLPNSWIVDSVYFVPVIGTVGPDYCLFLHPDSIDCNPGGQIDYGWADSLEGRWPSGPDMEWRVYQSTQSWTKSDPGTNWQVDLTIKMTVLGPEGDYDLSYFVTTAALDFSDPASGSSTGLFYDISEGHSITVSGGGMYKLLLTEFVVTPTAGEFIEIFNPNASPVDLTNYYLSDVAFAGGPEYYYHVVKGVTGGGLNDFNSKFPDGAIISAGEHQTIALNGDTDFFSTYGQNPTYEIDRDEFRDGPPDAIPDMMETHPGSIYGADSSHNPGLSNGDEMIMLYYWDGMSDLVADVDYVLYNFASPTPNDEAVDKTGITIDGPDADTTNSPYLDDTPEANQVSALSPTFG